MKTDPKDHLDSLFDKAEIGGDKTALRKELIAIALRVAKGMLANEDLGLALTERRALMVLMYNANPNWEDEK